MLTGKERFTVGTTKQFRCLVKHSIIKIGCFLF